MELFGGAAAGACPAAIHARIGDLVRRSLAPWAERPTSAQVMDALEDIYRDAQALMASGAPYETAAGRARSDSSRRKDAPDDGHGSRGGGTESTISDIGSLHSLPAASPTSMIRAVPTRAYGEPWMLSLAALPPRWRASDAPSGHAHRPRVGLGGLGVAEPEAQAQAGDGPGGPASLPLALHVGGLQLGV